jgi:hypothetical protein
MAVIADCIEKSKATADQELIGDYIAATLGVLQTDNAEEDAFNMLGHRASGSGRGWWRTGSRPSRRHP